MSKKIVSHDELIVYRKAFDAAMQIFERSKTFPKEETYSLTDQVRRSSRSVCANIAEAWRKRRYEAAFVSKLSDSDGEAAETEVHLQFALSCGYLSAQKHAELLDHYDHICSQLSKMMNDAASWCGTGCELRELPAEYFVGASEPGEREERGERRAPEQSKKPIRYTLRRSHAPTFSRSRATKQT